MEIKWTEVDPQSGQRRYLAAARFAGVWHFRVRLARRGEWTRGLEPSLEMWQIVLDNLQRRYRRRQGVNAEDVDQVERIVRELLRRRHEKG
jgi:hypothetical protein